MVLLFVIFPYLSTRTKFARQYAKALQALAKAHLAIYFIQGHFPSIASRMTGVRFVTSRVSRNGSTPRASYRFLGYLLVAQLCLWAYFGARDVSERMIDGYLTKWCPNQQRKPQSSSVDAKAFAYPSDDAVPSFISNSHLHSDIFADLSCSICSGQMNHPATTQCGHMFCWQCIISWTTHKSHCPMCREPSTASSILCMYTSSAGELE